MRTELCATPGCIALAAPPDPRCPVHTSVPKPTALERRTEEIVGALIGAFFAERLSRQPCLPLASDVEGDA